MRTREMTTALVALALGAGVATACGGGGDRESVDQSNQGERTAEGSPATTREAGPTTLGSTGETQPDVTQPETGE